MLDTLITSKTRIKLLLRFFLNSNTKSYLRNLETEFDESTNSIRVELNRFEKAGLLVSGKEQNRKVFKANTAHPLFPDINNILRKYVGFDQIVDKVLGHLGSIKKAYITGDLARGKDTNKINLFLIGHEIDLDYLKHLINKTKTLIHRDIIYKLLDECEEAGFLKENPEAFMIWKETMGSEELKGNASYSGPAIMWSIINSLYLRNAIKSRNKPNCFSVTRALSPRANFALYFFSSLIFFSSISTVVA